MTNKTQITTVNPEDYIAQIEHPVRGGDAQTLLDAFSQWTGMTARMWGPSMIGYGQYHYKYDSGREGDFLMTGFSARKANMVIYVLPGYSDMADLLARLGKHKMGKSCLYINKLADIDMDVLKTIVLKGLDDLRARYETIET